NTSTYGQMVTFTVAVAANIPGSGTPTGTVTFKDGALVLGTQMLSSGTAFITTTTTALSVGMHNITVQYGGDANFVGTTSNALVQTVNQDGTNTALTSSAPISGFSQNVTFTATVTGTPVTITPTGFVSLKDGTSTIATAGLDASGVATFNLSNLSIGAHHLPTAHPN